MDNRIEFTCPHCKKKSKVRLNDRFTNEDISSIVSRKVFKILCKGCGNSTIVDYPFEIVLDNNIIYYTPGKSNTIKDDKHDIKRVCDTYDDLKEKVLIINDKLNDIVVEYIKLIFLSDLRNKKEDMPNSMRYDSSNEKEIIYYLLGLDKYVSISKDIYNNILSKSKIKPIKDARLVDISNIKKYIKL